jgi:hypothetical protein
MIGLKKQLLLAVAFLFCGKMVFSQPWLTILDSGAMFLEKSVGAGSISFCFTVSDDTFGLVLVGQEAWATLLQVPVANLSNNLSEVADSILERLQLTNLLENVGTNQDGLLGLPDIAYLFNVSDLQAIVDALSQNSPNQGFGLSGPEVLQAHNFVYPVFSDESDAAAVTVADVDCSRNLISHL